jgi:hypothetical protein
MIEVEKDNPYTWALNFRTSSLRLWFILLASSRTNFGELSPDKVGIGVVARGGLDRLDFGDVARETILDPGREAEKNFLDDPNTGLRDLELSSPSH